MATASCRRPHHWRSGGSRTRDGGWSQGLATRAGGRGWRRDLRQGLATGAGVTGRRRACDRECRRACDRECRQGSFNFGAASGGRKVPRGARGPKIAPELRSGAVFDAISGRLPEAGKCPGAPGAPKLLRNCVLGPFSTQFRGGFRRPENAPGRPEPQNGSGIAFWGRF